MTQDAKHEISAIHSGSRPESHAIAGTQPRPARLPKPAEPLPSAGSEARDDLRWQLNGAAIRCFDILVSATLLIALLPVILIAVIVIRLDSPGRAFFRVDRVGYHSRALRMLKFRKMRDDATGPNLTTHGDHRFTRVGVLLAKLKLDELPQLWHVLRGEMSLVGPRPESPEFVAMHERIYETILSVRPGSPASRRSPSRRRAGSSTTTIHTLITWAGSCPRRSYSTRCTQRGVA